MKKTVSILLSLVMLLGGVSAYADTSDRTWLYEGSDCLIKDYDDELTAKTDINVEPAQRRDKLVWASGEDSGNGTGALSFTTTEYAWESPSYNLPLTVGRTYKLSLDVKPEVDIYTDRFSIWLSAKDTDGNFQSIKKFIDGNTFVKGQWQNVSCYVNWDGVIDGKQIAQGNVNVKITFGSAGVSAFTPVTGSADIPIAYSFDNFSIVPYIPDLKVKLMGEYRVGETVSIQCFFDYLTASGYESFNGFDSAAVAVKADGEEIVAFTEKEGTLLLTDELAGKKITYEITPTVYSHRLETVRIDGGTVAKRENTYSLAFNSKVIADGMTDLAVTAEKNTYDGETSAVYIATYKGGRLISVSELDEDDPTVSTDGADEIKGFFWNDKMSPLTDAAAAERAVSIFVDPQNGSDLESGSYTAPFKTVKRAKERVSELITEAENRTNVGWHYKDNVLTVGGSGKMPNYKPGKAPWEEYKAEIRTLMIEEGVTGVGENAFNGFYNIKNAVLPESLETISEGAFLGCTRLAAVVLSDNTAEVSQNAFEESTSVCVSKTSPLADTAGFKTYTDGEKDCELLEEEYNKDSDISWALYEDTLVISGTSSMTNSLSGKTVPWAAHCADIVKAVIQPGVTRTPMFLFAYDSTAKAAPYTKMKIYTVADTVIRAASNEFSGCPALEVFDMSSATTQLMHYISGDSINVPIKQLTIPKGINEVGGCAFNRLSSLESLVFEEGFNYKPSAAAANEWSSGFRSLGSLKTIVFPKSMEKLGAYFISRATSLESITVYNPNMEFEENCLYGYDKNDLTVYGYKGSTAEKLAEAKGYTFSEITDEPDTEPEAPADGEEADGIDKIYVLLKGGEHFIDEELSFGYTDCSENIEVIYTSYGDGRAVLTGGVKVDPASWTLHDAEKGIYKSYVGTDIDSRQFFVNGVRADRAKSQGGFTNYSVDAEGYLCDNTELLTYEHPEDIEIQIHVAWITPSCGVDSIYTEVADDGSERVRVKMKSTAWDIIWGRSQTNFTQLRPNNPYRYENAYELIDEEGEWYLNRHDGYLYYKPRCFEDLTTAEAVIPTTERLVMVEGTKAQNVQNITFDNLEFAYSTWLRPSTDAGHCSGQNNTIWDGDVTIVSERYYPDAAVEVKCADNIDFTGCTFTKLGTVALKLHGGVHGCSVIGNEFYDLSAAAIIVSEKGFEARTDEDDRYVNRDITVSNNLIHSVARDFNSSAALTTGYVKNTTVSNNEIFDTPYTGMHLGFVENDNYICGLRIENNYVHDYMTGMTDGGGIYFFTTTAGTEENPNIVKGNYVSHGWHGVSSISLDYDTSNVTFENNVTDGVNNSKRIDSYAAIWSNGWIPRDYGVSESNKHENLTFKNNFGTNGYIVSGNPTDCSIESHTVCEMAAWTDEAKAIIRNAGVEDRYLSKMQSFPREIEIPENIELAVGDVTELAYTAYDENESIYSGDDIEVYCYSSDNSVLTASNGSTLTAVGTGEATLKVIFKCKTVLRQRTVAVTVK